MIINMGDCFSCLIDNVKHDLGTNNGLGTVNTHVHVVNVGTSIANLEYSKDDTYKKIDDEV